MPNKKAKERKRRKRKLTIENKSIKRLIKKKKKEQGRIEERCQV